MKHDLDTCIDVCFIFYRYLLDYGMLHPTEKYYPLRPEFAESTFYLYQATKGAPNRPQKDIFVLSLSSSRVHLVFLSS
jgi:mannosidase alpha-like ER degradation enhancer 1